MLDEILAIPGNRAVFNSLRELLREKRGIAFVGAGASAGLYPLWGALIERLADYAVDQGKAEPRDALRWKGDRTSTPQQRINAILRKLGNVHYEHFLRETFAPRTDADGKRYTKVHELLIRLPFCGFVTTNYDPALDFARMDWRPGSVTSGTPTWQDDYEVHRWLTGDVFRIPDACPILWLHGYWQRPSGIVLNSGEYADAYKPGLYRKTFERLWEQDHLVFVGFGFNDPQFTFIVGEILHSIAGAIPFPRHIALLGLPPGSDGPWPTTDAIIEFRTNLEEAFHVRPLFYRVVRGPDGREDHSELSVLLDGLLEHETPAHRPVHSARSGHRSTALDVLASSPVLPLISHWEHETTDDEMFTGRADECTRLDRWVRDGAVRAIGVTAVGGTGKTALVGQWLKHTIGWRSRPFQGLFGWSFYQERDTARFLGAFLDWAHRMWGTPAVEENTDLTAAAFKVLRERCIVIVLDGLEVLQEGPHDSRFGSFLDGVLRDFLSAVCAREHGSLAILTSRFLFTDLERHLGTAFRQIELPGLMPQHGAALLADLDVLGPLADREQVSRRLEGHPLGLRIFADALPHDRREEPWMFLQEAFNTGKLSADAPLGGKIKRLLTFYERNLSRAQVRLLGVVALFRTPVDEDTILRLTSGLFSRHRKEPLPDPVDLAVELQRLYARGILNRDPIDGRHCYTCHPILRDYFRAVLLGTGTRTARKAADLLTGHPSAEKAHTLAEIEPVLATIELLLDAGDFELADELYSQRLDHGLAFARIPSPLEGLRCALGFVSDQHRREQCEDFSSARVSFYLNEVGLFARASGHLALAAHYYGEANKIDRETQDRHNLSIGLQNEAGLAIRLGRLPEAMELAQEALDIATLLRSDELSRNSFACRGWARTLAGQAALAAEDFASANVIEMSNDGEHASLYSGRGIQWAELFLRTGHSRLARQLTEQNLKICEYSRWSDDIAVCHWVLACCALAEGCLDLAEYELRQAEPIMHRGHLLFDLARLHVTMGMVALAQGDAGRAQTRSEEAIGLAQPRGMRLVHADALVLRGRALLKHAIGSDSDHDTDSAADLLSRALDDAEDALRLSRGCRYAWCEHDAFSLQSDVHDALENLCGYMQGATHQHRELRRRASEDAEALAVHLQLTADQMHKAEDTAARARQSQEHAGGKIKTRDLLKRPETSAFDEEGHPVISK